MTIRVLVDSTCDVPPALAEELGIAIVPVYINVGDQSYLDGVDLTRHEFYEDLPGYNAFPTTAAPAPAVFTAAYQALVDEGATEIISVHLATKLSNTLNAARLGSFDVEGAEIMMWDSEQLALGSGLQAIVAAEAAADGKSVPEIMAMLHEKREKTRIFAMLDTLEFLRRSGRVSWAEFGLGTIMRIKPIVQVYAGEVTVIEKVRTSKRALPRLVQLVESYGPIDRIGIEYAGNLETAERLRQEAQHLFTPGSEINFMELTPAIGSHAGPGVVGLGFIAK
ncbi:MAG: DegV family protein [Candidatus Promineifilaceae bacterium]|jgi:DegV family protein with EDD domain